MRLKESNKYIKTIVLTGLFFAMAIVLAIIENMLPPVITVVPGIKLGLSNIIVMYTLFFINKKASYEIAVLKAGFVFITRGSVAAFLSLMGGLLSVTVMLILMIIFKDKISYLMLSVSGALFHNIGQFIAVSIVYRSIGLWGILPVLIISGVITGCITSVLLRLVMPAFLKFNKNNKE